MAKRKSKKPKPPPHIRTAMVPNPHFAPEHPISVTNPKETPAVINTKESAIETLYARGKLEPHQKKAADYYLALHMRAGGILAAIDYSRDKVDGGSGSPIMARLHAVREIEALRDIVGSIGITLLNTVCCEGRALAELGDTNRQRTTLADNLRSYLDEIAYVQGFAMRRYGEQSKHLRSA